MKAIVSAIFSVLMVVGCNQIEDEKSTETVNENQSSEVVVNIDKVEVKENIIEEKKAEPIKWQQAKVKYMSFEGGFYGLITHNGDKYLPLNLDKTFQQDGAIVNIQGEVVNNMMTIQQWGKPFKISDIQLVKAGRVKVPTKDK